MNLLDILPDELLIILFRYTRNDFERLFVLGNRYILIYDNIRNLIREGKIDPNDYFSSDNFDLIYSDGEHDFEISINSNKYTMHDVEYKNFYGIFRKAKIIRKFFAIEYDHTKISILIYQIFYDQPDIPEFNLFSGHSYYVCERYSLNVYENTTFFDYSEEWNTFWKFCLNEVTRNTILNSNLY
jgi:hypothetical protein